MKAPAGKKLLRSLSNSRFHPVHVAIVARILRLFFRIYPLRVSDGCPQQKEYCKANNDT